MDSDVRPIKERNGCNKKEPLFQFGWSTMKNYIYLQVRTIRMPQSVHAIHAQQWPSKASHISFHSDLPQDAQTLTVKPS